MKWRAFGRTLQRVRLSERLGVTEFDRYLRDQVDPGTIVMTLEN